MGMESLLGLLCNCMIVFLAATSSVEAAREFKVGDDLGWHEPGPNNTAFYSQWAAKNRFQVGDSLGKFVRSLSYMLKYSLLVAY